MMAGAHYASAAPAGVARASSVASSSPATTARALRRLAQGATARRAPPCRPAPIDALAFSARATGGFGGARFGHAGGRDALPQGRKLMQSSAMAQPRELVDDDGVDDTGGPTRIQRFNGNELDITVSNNGYSRRAYFSGYDMDVADDSKTEKKTSDLEGDKPDNLAGLIDEVQTVETVEEAKRVLGVLMSNLGSADRPIYHAVDTEVADIDVADQTPVGHGVVTCFSVFCGPDVDFAPGAGGGGGGGDAAAADGKENDSGNGNGDGGGGTSTGAKRKSLLWVDTLKLGDEGWAIFKPYFESPDAKKVWHNYSFDRHVIENHGGIKLAGFAADTMHMARLWNSNRKLEGGYSLEALTSDPKVMSEAGEMFSEAGEELIRSKRGMKKIFGKPKIKKDGTPGKTIELPPIDQIQNDPEQRETWIEYSALDAQATWFLRESLEAKLRGISCDACPRLSAKPTFHECANLWEFYTTYLREFGEVLTDMESAGMFVDKKHLEGAEKQALADKKVAEDYFRRWAMKMCPAAEHMNVGSGIQVRQLLFAGARNKRPDKPGVEKEREFAMVSPEWTAWDEGGREGKAPKKGAKFTLHGVTKRDLAVPVYTATGLPAVSSVVLRSLAGRPGAAREIVDTWDALTDAEKTNDALKKRCGAAYDAFGGGYDGAEACAAVDALNDVAAIDTLLSNFIIPLQSDNLRGKTGRVHTALNINTETGRLSARRPSLQNQPALEKDRYGIRKAFTCRPGNILVVADYGQLELRLLAHMAGCASMREAFEAGGDFHSRTAMGMYKEIREAMDEGKCLLEYGSEGYDEDEANRPALVKDMFASERRKAKVLNFSIAYGKTAHGLAKDFGVSTKEAEDTVNLWYSDRPEVRAWQEVQHANATKLGKVSTLLGRHRNLPEASSRDEMRRQHALRASINTPIQGGAADIAMLAMMQIHRCPRLKEIGYELLMQIHDEVILEGPEEHKDEALALVKRHMENPFNDHENLCDVDLNVDGNYAKTWFEAK